MAEPAGGTAVSSMLTTMAAESQVAVSADSEVPEGISGDLRELIGGYRAHTPPVRLARMFASYREEHAISKQELGRRMGITAAVVHHHESLLTLAPELVAALEDGRLAFKEGRAIADIRFHNGRYGPDHDRQREIAAMFLSNRVSSVYVEAVVAAAKAAPQADVDTVLERAIGRVKSGRRPPKHILQVAPPSLKANVPTPTELKTKILNLAADFTLVGMHPYCETEMLAVCVVARILVDRMKSAGVCQVSGDWHLS